MTCTTSTTTGTWSQFDITESYPNLGIGYRDMSGPDTFMKDIRYYYNTSLDSSTMNVIKDVYTCKQL